MQIRLYYIYTIYTWLYGLHVQIIIIIIILPLLLAIRFDYLNYGFWGNPDSGIQGNSCFWNKGCWALECTKSQKFDVLVMYVLAMLYLGHKLIYL